MAEFFHMGGYAAYVWTVYGLAFVVSAGIAVQSLRDYRAQRQLVARLEEAAGGRVRRAAYVPGEAKR